MQTGAGTPHVTVLLATHNGRAWLPEQVDSILSQEGVKVRLIASDDSSTDGTAAWLAERAEQDERVEVLSPRPRPEGAAANFYRLLDDLDTSRCDLIAFSDQDDVWLPGKLARHAARLRTGDVDGVSSNVTAFSASGARAVVRKDFPQRRYDYLLESPGPGSTFLLSRRVVELVQEVLRAPASPAGEMDFHDWLVYGVCRARGWGWFIDSTATVEYRQHGMNAFGANSGLASATRRLSLIRSHWHRRQAALMARVGLMVAPPATAADLTRVLRLLEDESRRSRPALVRLSTHLRRRPRDRAIIAGLIAAGLW